MRDNISFFELHYETKYSRLEQVKFLEDILSKKLKRYSLLKVAHTCLDFLKGVFHKFY